MARFSLSCFLLAALCALHAGATAQQRRVYAADKYLQPLVQAEQDVQGLSAGAAARPPSHALQSLATERAYVGDIEGAIAAFDQQGQSRPPQDPRQVAQIPGVLDARAEDAIRAIVDEARSKRIVLINEAHHMPMHRAFTRRLAQELRKIGYSYLAAETFNIDEQGRVPLTASGKTRVGSGGYTKDPVFAQFVSEAVADGWTLVPYEIEDESGPDKQGDPMARMREREQAQARQLIERTLGKDKDAKVLVHVGFHHLIKQTPEDKAKMSFVPMGELIRQTSGVPTLHVDQTQFHAHPDRSKEGPLYAGLVDKFPMKEPFVLRAPDGSHPVLGGFGARIDMQVIFPRYGVRDGRAEWLQTLAGRSPRVMPAELLPQQGRRVVKAYRTTDGPDAVPVDVVLLEAGKPAPKLMLPAGEFRYEFEE